MYGGRCYHSTCHKRSVMSNPFLAVAKYSEMMVIVMKNRAKAMDELTACLNKIQVYTLGIGKLGVSEKLKQGVRQKDILMAEIIKLHDTLYNLALIHEQEIEVGMKCAEAFTILHSHIDKNGFPKNREEARRL
jgi:hypothetical protein